MPAAVRALPATSGRSKAILTSTFNPSLLHQMQAALCTDPYAWQVAPSEPSTALPAQAAKGLSAGGCGAHRGCRLSLGWESPVEG